MVVHTAATNEPIIPTDEDARALHDAACALAGKAGEAATLILADGSSVEIPIPVLAAIRQTLGILSNDQAVAVTPVDKHLSPYQAALMLNVREKYVERLLEEGDIPFTTTGTFRQIALEDLMAYKRVKDAQTRAALEELTRLSEEMGLYDHEL